jgi:septum formation protein
MLLREQGYACRVQPPPYQEPGLHDSRLTPAQHAEALSFFKARSVASEVEAGMILGADTVVAYAGRLFGKPHDADDARKILGTLCGTTHEVITGVTLLDAESGSRLIEHETTRVTMRRMSRDELEAYIASGSWQGKAGAYGIQDRGDAFVERIEGSFSNIVGLPMELLARMLDEFTQQR